MNFISNFRRLPMPLQASLLLAWLLVTPSLCFSGPPAYTAGSPTSGKDHLHQSPAPRANPGAAELEALSLSAEEIFELALAGKLDRMGRRLDSVRKNATLVPAIPDDTNLLLPRLTHTIADLDQAITSKDRLDTMRYANRITLIAATVAVPLKPCVPTEVSLLEYNVRELEIWSEVKRSEKLSNIAIRMHLAWQTLMPRLVNHNASRELKRFSDLMGRLEVAKAPEEYARVSRLMRSELYPIRALFARPAR